MNPDPSSPIQRYALETDLAYCTDLYEDDNGEYMRYADHVARLAQLAQEQATLQASLDSLYGAKFSDRVYVALKARAETAEAALGETRQALQQLQQEHDELLARVGPSVPGAAPTGSTAARNEP